MVLMKYPYFIHNLAKRQEKPSREALHLFLFQSQAPKISHVLPSFFAKISKQQCLIAPLFTFKISINSSTIPLKESVGGGYPYLCHFCLFCLSSINSLTIPLKESVGGGYTYLCHFCHFCLSFDFFRFFTPITRVVGGGTHFFVIFVIFVFLALFPP